MYYYKLNLNNTSLVEHRIIKGIPNCFRSLVWPIISKSMIIKASQSKNYKVKILLINKQLFKANFRRRIS